MHKIYYISEAEGEVLKVEKKSLKLDINLVEEFLKEFKGCEVNIKKSFINIIILLKKSEMFIQTLQEKCEKIYKTKEPVASYWRPTEVWNPNGKNVNLMAKSLYNNPYGIF